MPRRSPLPYLLAALALVASIGVALGQQQLGNPVCELDPDGAVPICAVRATSLVAARPTRSRKQIMYVGSAGRRPGAPLYRPPTPHTKTLSA